MNIVQMIKNMNFDDIKVYILMIKRMNLVNDKWRRVRAHYRHCLILVNIWSGHRSISHCSPPVGAPAGTPSVRLETHIRAAPSLLLTLQGNDEQNIFDELLKLTIIYLMSLQNSQ